MRYWFSRFLRILNTFAKLCPCKLLYIFEKDLKRCRNVSKFKEIIIFYTLSKTYKYRYYFLFTWIVAPFLEASASAHSNFRPKFAEIKFSGIFINTIFFRQAVICFLWWCYKNSGLRFYWTFFIIFSKSRFSSTSANVNFFFERKLTVL